jgi:[ribosomal protein S5]-alanine N-acetyltransferase
MRPRIEYARLEGERVVLRPVSEGDALRAFELIAGRREILRWLIWDGPASVLELEERYRRWRLDESEPRFDRQVDGKGSDYQFAICERRGQGFVGAISVRFRGHSDEGDLGYWIGTEYWGRGFASEAVRLVDRFAFQHVGANALCACVFAGNDASRCVLERNGYAHEHTRPANIAKRGQLIDEWYFALTRSEWRRREGDWLPAAEDVRAEGTSGATEVPA